MTTLGIIGGGQLGRMLALAALPLGVRCRFLASPSDSPIAALADRYELGDPKALIAFATDADAVTAEYEAIDLSVMRSIDALSPLRPRAQALLAKQNRIVERELLTQLKLPQPRWAKADRANLAEACERIGYPCRVKIARGGFDGRGQWRIERPQEVARVPADPLDFVVEQEIAFDDEFSLVASRRDDDICFWTPTLNEHRNGILARSRAALGLINTNAVQAAEQIMRTLLQQLDYCGTLAIEFFRIGESVLINEFAPRVHNSGHWTIDGACTSQFENHVRAVLKLPLGSTALRSPTQMWNILTTWPDREQLLAIPGLHVHDYDKAPRPPRKIGHLTLIDVAPNDPRVALIDRLLGLPPWRAHTQ